MKIRYAMEACMATNAASDTTSPSQPNILCQSAREADL